MRALAAAASPPLRALFLLLSPRLPPPIPRPRFIMDPSPSSSSGGHHPVASQQRGGDGGRRGGGGGSYRADALGSSSPSSAGYHSMVSAFDSLHLRGDDGRRPGGGGVCRGGRGGGDGSDRVDAFGSSSSSPSAGYHSRADAFASPQPRGGGGRRRGGGGRRRGGGGGERGGRGDGNESDRIAALGRLL